MFTFTFTYVCPLGLFNFSLFTNLIMNDVACVAVRSAKNIVSFTIRCSV